MPADDGVALRDRLEADVANPPPGSVYARLCPGLAVIADGNGLIVEGGLRRRRITGAGQRLISRLRPLLDGRRTVEEVADEAGLPLRQVQQAVLVLRRADLVEYSELPLAADWGLAAAHAAAFLSRTAHATGAHRNSADLLDALAGSTVMALAPAQAGEALRDDLLCCGIGHVLAADIADPAATACAIVDLAGAPRSLVVAVDDDTTGTALASAEAACRRLGVPLLRGARTGSVIEIGPLFYPGHTACLACFRRGRSEFFSAQTAHSGGDGPRAPALEWAAGQALAAMLADEALAALGAVRAIRALRAMTLTSLTDGSERRLLVLPYPDCAVCGTSFPSAVPADDAATYEWEVQHTPRWLQAPGPATALLQPGVRNLVSERPYFAPGPSFQLPDVAVAGEPGDAGSSAPPTARLDMPVLGGVLARIAGRRRPGHATDFSRWAPSGGNLASVRVYVAAFGAGFGPAGGRLTTYDDMAHRLVAVRATQVPPERLLAGTGLSPADPCAVLVFTADVARIARKYSSFGYRLAHLDAGVAATQLAVVAGQAGLRVRFAPAWHSQVGGVLELRPNEEFVTAMALVTQEERAHAAGC